MHDAHLYAVILAGGSGQRFWPLSRELNPKQLLSVFGTESLINQAIRRIEPYVAGQGGVTIVTNERLLDELRNHLLAQSGGTADLRFLMEPLPRNTASAIALAAADLVTRDPGAIMVVLASDHLLDEGALWADALRTGSALARDGYLATIGISPTCPETGYGYIKVGAPLSAHGAELVTPMAVAEFVEKPDLEHARAYVESGDYLWNAGIFVMRAAQVLAELEAAGPREAAIVEACRWLVAHGGDAQAADEARERFAALEPVSIDVALMECSPNVAVIPAALKWSDVGTLLALQDVAPADENGNVRVGRGIDLDSTDSIIYSSDRLVATLGVDDLIVVDTSDATLVAAKDRAQDVRLIFDALRAQGAEEIVQPKVALRPWGSWTTLLKGPGFQIKLLVIDAGRKPSLQRHEHRSEHWIVVEGEAVVTREHEETLVRVNENAFIPAGMAHRVENRTSEPLKIIEVQVGGYLGDDDIVRLADDWGRE